ncbi:glycosyltransferase [Mycolicibacterium vanbaalenii]|uniref:Glycosyl transferase, family 2 n=1 Tax=Mycolicibacterium vanbaalenii (strain DSM 7251 / JCM 13017 / BCRC 16820 / KCTC 9966 / NRRL B-24157 / PYR-1) TaxID=350058 RepID=A1T4K0_MYCVP|nr:glycosyltransferase [Mycolicibacterium vanbaalenii]ABM12100.1 glycosyl transferase, family 2 [Mycolicibacterium vanbaalenii PYR-1]MCV7127668.1 glycosyltransferase [Mycolicibacterium vanbaalenii PYR-1]UJL31112.1 glycosyltransferase [Mycolicibacterium vanbaalenii]WND57945.1 glycosyltransferase [Mycolicibacterium vanbaalenii]
MSDVRPAICLNMIVRNEAHIVHEVLDSVAPYIDSWVIVDTGSDDGTQDKIRDHMAALGIPGELHVRPWRNFGHNRSEALELARGHGDYIWVMDADDLLVGTPEFSGLTADVYQLHYGPDVSYWRRQLFRDGLPWRYVGVLHEYAECGGPCTEERLRGDYHIESRRLGGRNLDPEKYARDAEVLLAEVERNPDDPRSVFYLAQSYYDYGDYASAHKWYRRRTEMAGFDEEVYYALVRVADTMLRLGEPWPPVQDAFLRAWEYRPWRAEALYAVARWYRDEQRYQLGHLFAERAARIPMPDQDVLFVNAEIYSWRASDEQAVCASWIGRQEETFALCRQLLNRTDIPEEERCRIAGNRDLGAAHLLDAAATYPESLAHDLHTAEGDITVTVVAGPDRSATERTLNSVLHCFSDLTRVGRVLVIDIGLWPNDRAELAAKYPFLEFRQSPPGVQRGQLRDLIDDRFWLHLGMGWQFFAPDDYIRRLTSVLDAEPEVCQVGINFGDADKLTGCVAQLTTVRGNADTGRYVLTETAADGPAMFDCTRWDGTEAGLRAASLDEVLCVLQG